MTALTVILPVYNEEECIASVLNEWAGELDKLGITYEVMVCEDGSTDQTKSILRSLESVLHLTLNQKEIRRGYGGAIIDGINTARGEWILCIDSDGQCDPADVRIFWENRLSGSILIGWRTNRQDPLQRKLFSRFFFAFFRLLFHGCCVHDPSAPFVLFERGKIIPYLDDLKYLREGFWWGFVAMCLKRKIAIYERPVNHRLRLGGKTRVYLPSKVLQIGLRNCSGLLRYRLAK